MACPPNRSDVLHHWLFKGDLRLIDLVLKPRQVLHGSGTRSETPISFGMSSGTVRHSWQRRLTGGIRMKEGCLGCDSDPLESVRRRDRRGR